MLHTGMNNVFINTETDKKLQFLLNNIRERDKKEVLARRFHDDIERVYSEFIQIHQAQMLDCVYFWSNANDTVIFCYGVVVKTPKVGQVFFLTNGDVKQCDFISVARGAQKQLGDCMNRFHRLELEALQGDEKMDNFIKLFGFKQECILSQAGKNKENYVLYSRTL